jgi:hypothetical protein
VVDVFLIKDINAYQHGEGSADGNTRNVDQREQLMLCEVTDGNDQIISKHMYMGCVGTDIPGKRNKKSCRF